MYVCGLFLTHVSMRIVAEPFFWVPTSSGDNFPRLFNTTPPIDIAVAMATHEISGKSSN